VGAAVQLLWPVMDCLVNADLIHLGKKVMNTEPALLTPILCHDGVYRTVIKRIHGEAFTDNNRQLLKANSRQSHLPQVCDRVHRL
jgi:hypothetical protein